MGADWLTAIARVTGPDAAFWIGYLTNGKHIAWYLSIGYTLAAALGGGAVALLVGMSVATARRSRLLPLRFTASAYINVVRGVPDVLFFLFFPLAFEHAVEWISSLTACAPGDLAAPGAWPPCDAANWRLSSTESLLLAIAALGLVYGAFAGNVIAGALAAVPTGQLDAARAFGLSRADVFRRVHLPQMWVYALPGLSNVWMSLLKATSLLSLLQIIDFVAWAQRLGGANFTKAAGLVHDDWRWRYYAVLLLFYVVMTFFSEKAFAALIRRARRGMPAAIARAV